MALMDKDRVLGHVLLVDDNPRHRRGVSDMLGEELRVVRVLEAARIKELLATLVLDRTLLCAIIAWELADQGGRAAADALWLLAPNTPVIFHTSGSGSDFDASAFPAPVVMLSKPLRIWDIQVALRKVCPSLA